jgi:hypothetical protein
MTETFPEQSLSSGRMLVLRGLLVAPGLWLRQNAGSEAIIQSRFRQPAVFAQRNGPNSAAGVGP